MEKCQKRMNEVGIQSTWSQVSYLDPHVAGFYQRAISNRRSVLKFKMMQVMSLYFNFSVRYS